MIAVGQRAGTVPVETSGGSRPLPATKFPGFAVPLSSLDSSSPRVVLRGALLSQGCTFTSFLHVQRPTVGIGLQFTQLLRISCFLSSDKLASHGEAES